MRRRRTPQARSRSPHADKDVAQGRGPRRACTYRNGTDTTATTSASTPSGRRPGPGQRRRHGRRALGRRPARRAPTATLNDLALLLLLVSGIGVVGAGAAGLWVARAGLRPVDELTDAVEHVARTEDLTVRIPVEGEDEIARLSRSFNSMTAALASSRDRQAAADRGRRARAAYAADLAAYEHRAARPQRGDRPGRSRPTDRKALLASVKAQMTELAALIGDLQELSRPDAGQPRARCRWSPCTRSSRRRWRRARLRGPELTHHGGRSQPWYVRAEPAALERAVVNVLDNAVKFSPPGGTVEVRADGRRADGTGPRPRHPRRRTPARLRAVLALPVARARCPARAWACRSWPVRSSRRAARSRCGPGGGRRHGGGDPAAGGADAAARPAGEPVSCAGSVNRPGPSGCSGSPSARCRAPSSRSPRSRRRRSGPAG